MHENRRFLSTGMDFAENAYAYVLKARSRSYLTSVSSVSSIAYDKCLSTGLDRANTMYPTAMSLPYLRGNNAHLQSRQHEQWPKVDVTVRVRHFRANMTVTWPSTYIVFALSRPV